MARKAHITLIQEHCLTEALANTFKIRANKACRTLIVGPSDPEHGKASAGVGILCSDDIKPYPIPKPTEAYLDAVETGRCMILNFDLEKDTLPIAIMYGWTGGAKGTIAADRTNDLLDSLLEQMSLLPEGPKLIASDFNGTHDGIQHLHDMITKHGWIDVGATRRLCPQGVNQNTCHTNSDAKQSRIDLIPANCHAESALSNFKVDQEDLFLTHRPVGVELTV